jgi:hypothetical protein
VTEITNVDAGSGLGPIIQLFRDSASPAANDLLGALEMLGRSSLGNKVLYAFIYAYIVRETDGSEQGGLSFQTKKNGVLTDALAIQTGDTQLYHYDDGASLGPLLKLFRYSNTPSSNDLLGAVEFFGRTDTAANVIYGFIYGFITNPANASYSGGISIQSSKNGVLSDAFVIGATKCYSTNGLFSSSPTGGIGYQNGAGGTVTQLTSKTTPVTLNKVSGTITMNAEALGNNAIATFVVNATPVEIADIPMVSVQSPQSGKYHAWISGVSAGLFEISVQNLSGVALSDPVILNVGLFKGSTT